MSSSSDRRSRVLSEVEAVEVTPARMSLELRHPTTFTLGGDRSAVHRWLDETAAAATESLREAAHAEGFAQGFAQGARAAEDAARETEARRARELAEQDRVRAIDFQRALVAVDRAASSLEASAAAPAADVEQILVESAFALVEALLGRELAVAQQPGMDAVRRALALAPQGRPVIVRLNPADRAAVAALSGNGPGDGPGDGQGDGQGDWQGGRDVQLVPDPSLAPGDSIAECDATRIDARLEAALARVKEVLAA